MSTKCYFNGKFTDIDNVKINPYDLGFLRGYAVFDVMRTVNGKVFLLKEHWDRFVNSANQLNLKIPVSQDEFQGIVEKLIEDNGLNEINIRTVLTGGVSNNAFTLEGNETFLVTTEVFRLPHEDVFKNGAKVITEEYKRFIPTAKIASYIAAIRLQDEKNKSGSIEIVYTDKGKVLEASTSNLFIIKDGKIITTNKGVLFGTTRNLVVDLAKKNSFEVEERQVKMDEMLNADEVFLTATNKNIIPVIKIDDREVGNGGVGEITKRLMEIFDEFLKNY